MFVEKWVELQPEMGARGRENFEAVLIVRKCSILKKKNAPKTLPKCSGLKKGIDMPSCGRKIERKESMCHRAAGRSRERKEGAR